MFQKRAKVARRVDQPAGGALGEIEQVVDSLIPAEVVQRRSAGAVENGRPARTRGADALHHSARQAPSAAPRAFLL